jgi:hypothetical protein
MTLSNPASLFRTMLLPVLALTGCHYHVSLGEHDWLQCQDDYVECLTDANDADDVEACEQVREECELECIEEEGPGASAGGTADSGPATPPSQTTSGGGDGAETTDSGADDGSTTDGDGGDTEGGDGDESTSGDGDGDGDESASGDGDGDESTSGDGDGDESTSGDGDESTSGDGDGDGDGAIDPACFDIYSTCVSQATSLLEIDACEVLFEHCANPECSTCEPECPGAGFEMCLDTYTQCVGAAMTGAEASLCEAEFDVCAEDHADPECTSTLDPDLLEECLDEHALCLDCLDDPAQAYACMATFEACVGS